MTVSIDALTERAFFAWYGLYTDYASGEGVRLSDEQVMKVWTDLQVPGAVAAVARDESGELIGFAHAVPFTRLLPGSGGTQLEEVFVTPAARRRGTATALIEHVHRRAEADGRELRWEPRTADAAAKALSDKLAAASTGRTLQTLPVG